MDTYTKIVLTVIAIALSAISLQNMGVLPALAQQQEKLTRVEICGSDPLTSGTNCAAVRPGGVLSTGR